MNQFQVNLFQVWPAKDKEYHFKTAIKSFDKDCELVWDKDHFNLRTKLTMEEARLSSVEKIEFISFRREYPEGVIYIPQTPENIPEPIYKRAPILFQPYVQGLFTGEPGLYDNESREMKFTTNPCSEIALHEVQLYKHMDMGVDFRVSDCNTTPATRWEKPTSTFLEDLRRGKAKIEGKI